MKVAALFPGQGSQKPGMGKDLFDNFEAARLVFDEVSEAVGRSATELCFELGEDTLRQTQNAQLALFTCGVAAYRCLPMGSVFAGHSVGEYAALVAAGALSLSDGAKLVAARGRIMAYAGEVRKGTMSAVLGMDVEALKDLCAAVSGPAGVVTVANDNSPGQVVISGDVEAVALAGAKAQEAGAKRVIPLSVSGAFHSPLMIESAAQMGSELRTATFQDGQPVFANVTASLVPDSTAWPHLLQEQLYSPVRWTESVQNMVSAGVDTVVEYGVGEVLCGLVRRISKEVTSYAVFDSASLEKVKEAFA